MKDRIARDFLAYLPARIVPPIFALLAIPVFTHILSPHEYGSYLLATTTLTLIGSLCAAWLGSIVVRFRPALTGSRLHILCTPFLIMSIVAAASAWLITAIAQGEPFESLRYLVPGLVWIAAYAPFEYAAAWLRADNRAHAYTIALCCRAFGTLLLPIPFLLMRWGAGEVILWGGAFAMLVTLGVVALRTKSTFRGTAATGGTKGDITRRQLLHYGLPAALTNFALAGLSFADRYIVDGFLGTRAVAIYGASYDIAEKSVFFLNAMLLLSSTVMTVQLFEKEGETRAVQFLSELLRFYLIMVMPIIVVLVALAPAIVRLLMPPEYSEGALVLPLVAASAALVGIMHRYSLVLSLHKRTDLLMGATVAALIAKIAASFLIIPLMGIQGAAVSTVIGYAGWLALVRIVAARFSVPAFPWKSLARVVMAGLVAGLAAGALSGLGVIRLLLAATAALSVYGVFLILLQEISSGELKSLANLLLRWRQGKAH